MGGLQVWNKTNNCIPDWTRACAFSEKTNPILSLIYHVIWGSSVSGTTQKDKSQCTCTCFSCCWWLLRRQNISIHQEISAIAEGLCWRAHNTESVVCLPSRFMVFKQLYLCMLVTCLFRRTEKGILKTVEWKHVWSKYFMWRLRTVRQNIFD